MLRSLINSTSSLSLKPTTSQLSPTWILGTIHVRERMRKGTRIKRQMENKKRARIRAEEAKNAPPKKWIPTHIQMKLDSSTMKIGGHLEKDALLKKLPEDNVFSTHDFVPYPYELDDIISMFRDTHSPEMLNQPDALMHLFIEYDLRTTKKTKFTPSFEGLVHEIKHDIQLPQKRIVVAIVPDLATQDKALAAGASIVGGLDIIQDMKKGKLKTEDFDEVVVHGSMLVSLAPLRGILKTHFPTKQKGNYGTDIASLVTKFLTGVSYEMKRDDFDPSYGWSDFPFARLNMTNDQIRENLEATLARLETHRSPLAAPTARFIRRVYIKCRSDSDEKLLLKHWNVSTLKGIYTDPNVEEVKEVEEKIKTSISYFKKYKEISLTVINERKLPF